MGTETRSESTSGTPQTPAPRVLTGGCMCKSIRYKIARDECQERMNMSMYGSLFPCFLPYLQISTATFCCPAIAICVYFVVLVAANSINGSCHCGACQAMTSSAFSIGLVVPAQSFELSDPEGLLRIYEDSDPVTLASNRIAFCGKCGCYLMHEPVIFLFLSRTFLLPIESVTFNPS